MINRVLIVKETRPKESRVAMVPSDVKKLIKKGAHIWVEHLAGIGCGFTDRDYIDVGAQIVDFEAERLSFQRSHFQHPLFILRIKRAERNREIWENELYNKNIFMIGFLDPLKQNDAHIKEWLKSGVTSMSLELVTLDRDDPSNASAAMSRLAGPLAFEAALKNYVHMSKPLVYILGTGPAAMSAAMHAHQKGYEVSVFGRSEKYHAQLHSEGINYIKFPGRDIESQARYLDKFFTAPSIIITAARSPGERAPILIDRHSLNNMQAGSSIVDLSGEGGNVEITEYDTTVKTDNGIIISNCTGYPKIVPNQASEMYSKALLAFLENLNTAKSLEDSPLFQSCFMTTKGSLNSRIYLK